MNEKVGARRTVMGVALAVFFAGAVVAGVGAPGGVAEGHAQGAAPRYHFRLAEITVHGSADAPHAGEARRALEKEISERPEIATEAAVGGRTLTTFAVNARVERLETKLEPPRPGGRLKQLVVDVKLSLFGRTVPGEKLAFSGEGQATVGGEVFERRLEEETAALVQEALAQAARQALEQAISKLTGPGPAPGKNSGGNRRAPPPGKKPKAR